jgi:hypothetical protein
VYIFQNGFDIISGSDRIDAVGCVCVIVDRWIFHFVDVVPASMLSSLPQGFVYPQNGTEQDRSNLAIPSIDNRHAVVQCTARTVCVHAWYSVTMPSPDRAGSDVLLESQYSINLRYTRDTALFDVVACGLPTKGVTRPVQFIGLYSRYVRGQIYREQIYQEV